MPKVDILSVTGKKTGTRDLPPELFEAKISVPLMHQVVLAGQASLRRGTHSTKTRGDVRGGGKKPWRQKGTGRARQGSTRAPQWTGGGVVHGPHPRSHDMRVNKKMKKGALRSALTDALQSDKLVLIEDLTFDTPKTSQAAGTVEGLGLEGKVLLVLPEPTETGATEKSFRNLRGVRIAYAKSLGVYEVIASDKLVLTGSGLDALEALVAGGAGAPSAQRAKGSTNATADAATAEPGTRDPEPTKGEDA